MKLGRLRLLPTLVGVAGLAAVGMASAVPARADEPLIKYNSNGRDYWEHPPADWFMGDETAQQHGTHPYPGQPLPTPHDELVGLVKDNIKLLPGFHIEVLADQLDCARQMVFGPDNTLYVGCWTDHVFALKKQGDAWVSKVDHQGAAATDRCRLLQRQPLRYRHRQDLSLQGYRQQSRQSEG